MRIDYSNRRQVSVNRPKRNPFRPFLFLTLSGLAVVYGLGVATGWLLFRPGKQALPSPAQAVAAKSSVPAQPAKATPPSNTPAGNESTPHLTFYDSLPKGDKGLIGSGLNPQRDSQPAAPARNDQQPAADVQPKPVKAQKTSSQQPSAVVDNNAKPPLPAPPPAEKKAAPTVKAGPAPQKSTVGAPTYTVQLASYHDKKEAEELKAKWANNGYSVRIVESSVPGKGKLYRVRIGNRMSQEAANQLSGKLGSGAIAVPEQVKSETKTDKR